MKRVYFLFIPSAGRLLRGGVSFLFLFVFFLARFFCLRLPFLFFRTARSENKRTGERESALRERVKVCVRRAAGGVFLFKF